jgi:hypothetical protein
MLSLKDFADYYDLPYEQINLLIQRLDNPHFRGPVEIDPPPPGTWNGHGNSSSQFKLEAADHL